MNPEDQQHEPVQPSVDSIELDDALFARLMDHSDDPAVFRHEPAPNRPSPILLPAIMTAPEPVLTIDLSAF